MYTEVKILKSPVTERYVKTGDVGQLDEANNQIRVGGCWFDFDDRWKIEKQK